MAVAGRSNGLGPVLSGNTAYPVISCPPLTPDWGAQDVWSSLRLPSGKITKSSKSFYSQASNMHNGRENNIMKFYIPVTQLQKFTSCCICSPLPAALYKADLRDDGILYLNTYFLSDKD